MPLPSKRHSRMVLASVQREGGGERDDLGALLYFHFLPPAGAGRISRVGSFTGLIPNLPLRLKPVRNCIASTATSPLI